MVTDDQLAAEERIVWEQDPALHPYVRQTLVVTTNRRRPIRAPRYAVAAGLLVATRVGYSVLRPDAPHDARSGPRCFLRRVFWLKHYDRSLDPNGEHYRDDCPAEAVDPLTVRTGEAGERYTARALGRPLLVEQL